MSEELGSLCDPDCLDDILDIVIDFEHPSEGSVQSSTTNMPDQIAQRSKTGTTRPVTSAQLAQRQSGQVNSPPSVNPAAPGYTITRYLDDLMFQGPASTTTGTDVTEEVYWQSAHYTLSADILRNSSRLRVYPLKLVLNSLSYPAGQQI